MFLRAQRSKSVPFKAIRADDQPALIIAPDHSRELGLEKG